MSAGHTEGLKPCPFCRSKAKCNELRRGNYRREGDNYQVVCNKCRARGPLVQDSPVEAIRRWNEDRASTPTNQGSAS